MTNPVLNLQSKLVDKDGYIVSPWNNFFQQFTQEAPTVDSVTVKASPFSYKANARGTAIISGGTLSNLSLIRGKITIDITGQRIVPISIGDTIKLTYSVAPTLQFLGA